MDFVKSILFYVHDINSLQNHVFFLLLGLFLALVETQIWRCYPEGMFFNKTIMDLKWLGGDETTYKGWF